MNILTVFSLLLAFTSFQHTPSGIDQKAPSSVERATVYLSGAQVTRSAELQLKPGTNTIIFEGLSSLFSEQSIQISTDRQITILSLKKGLSNATPKNEKLDSLEQVKKDLESQIKLKQAEQSVLQRELEILLSNKELRGENQKISAMEIKQAMEYFRTKLNEIEVSRIDIADALNEAQQKLNEINRQINELKQQQRLKSGQIIAEIQSPRSQIVKFNISYFIRNAGWYPSYDVRVEDIDQPMELTYKANIYQNSGIDWKDVELSISSAEPLSSTTLPVLHPFYLGFYTSAPEMQERFEDRVMQKGQSLEEVVVAGDQANESPAVPSITVNQNQTSFTFTINLPYSIPGDGSSKTVSVKEHSLPASYRYFAAPKVSETAYLTARLTDWEDLNLLNGQMNLYFKQTFVGQSQLRTNTPGDTLQFSLGKDDGIVIKKNRLREFTEKNFFGNKVRETHAWELVVRNSKGQAIDLTLVDQVPVSTNEDIKVDIEEHSGASFNKTTGKLSWELTLDAGSTEKREFRYEVEYPSRRQLHRQ